MLALSTAADMRRADERAIRERGIPSLELMERASKALAAQAAALSEDAEETVLILCGSGNNGGDGIGAAAELLRLGRPVRALLVGDRAKMTPDARAMAAALEEKGGVLEDYNPAAPLPECAVIIDALFGVGLDRPLRGNALTAVEAINASGARVVSADIPSGVAADTGEILGAAVKADVTVTFSMGKPGHFAEPGCTRTGRLVVIDIGIPADILADCDRGTYGLEVSDAALPRRDPISHKGDYGRVLILGGCVGYTGAPSLCARAAVRAGAGLVYLGVPAPIYEITAVKQDEAMPFPLPAHGGGFAPGAAEGALERLRKCDVCAIGPGLGRGEGASALVEAVLKGAPAEMPLVLDADALNALAEHPEWLSGRTGPTVLTPHAGEFARLGGELTGDRVESARRYATEHGCILLLKGHRSIAAFPDGRAYLSIAGNPGMAKGGSGDTLTGILAAMLGQFRSDPVKAVTTGLLLHGLAGDRAARWYGEYAMTASDLLEALPDTMTDVSVPSGAKLPDQSE